MLRFPVCPFARHIVVLWNSLPASAKVTFVAVTIIHCHMAISPVTVIVCCCGLSVVRSRSIVTCCRCVLGRAKRHSRAVMCNRSVLVHSRLRHVTVGIEAIVLVVVSAQP